MSYCVHVPKYTSFVLFLILFPSLFYVASCCTECIGTIFMIYITQFTWQRVKVCLILVTDNIRR